jgi:hypothetical protein
MTKIGTAMALAIALVLAPSVSQAKGCIKGALVGGVAGHYAGHHGLLGAAAGCIVGASGPPRKGSSRRTRTIIVSAPREATLHESDRVGHAGSIYCLANVFGTTAAFSQCMSNRPLNIRSRIVKLRTRPAPDAPEERRLR